MLNLRQLVTQKDLGYQKLLTMGIQKLSTRQPALPLSYAELVEFLPIALTLLPAPILPPKPIVSAIVPLE
jgi:hypothetical protein